MADDNKPMKYFRYAIGEIVLVVIGILIALSINNWNEVRKDRIEERIALRDLKKEFVSNRKDVDSLIQNLFVMVHTEIVSLVVPLELAIVSRSRTFYYVRTSHTDRFDCRNQDSYSPILVVDSRDSDQSIGAECFSWFL